MVTRGSFLKSLFATPFVAALVSYFEPGKKIAKALPSTNEWRPPKLGDKMTVDGFGTGYVAHVGPDKNGFVDVVVIRWESKAASDDWSPAILARRRDLEMRIAIPNGC